jgi:hypothetical protein
VRNADVARSVRTLRGSLSLRYKNGMAFSGRPRGPAKLRFAPLARGQGTCPRLAARTATRDPRARAGAHDSACRAPAATDPDPHSAAAAATRWSQLAATLLNYATRVARTGPCGPRRAARRGRVTLTGGGGRCGGRESKFPSRPASHPRILRRGPRALEGGLVPSSPALGP